MKKSLLVTFLTGVVMNLMAQSSIEPIVTASWHQSEPFNEECPDGAAAGCGAIAVAQILNHYKMPLHGFGRATYENVDVNFDNRSIDWGNIRDSYPQKGYSNTEGKAVASLVYQVGAAMKMKYGSASSPHNYPSMMWGLQHHLHFAPQSRYHHRRYYSTAEWIEMLNSELEKGRPVFYRGDHSTPEKMVGHMYVIDGRDAEGYYHFNFGHANKKQDKYTDLNIINQGDGIWPGIYSVSYHHQQAMLTDFFPVDGLTDGDFDHTALVLNSPIVLESQPLAKTIGVRGTVQAKFQVRHVSFAGGAGQYSLGFYQQDKLVATVQTVRDMSFSDGGRGINIDRKFTLPKHLADGNYVMSIISRDDENSPWVRGWDNAPNRVPVNVKNNTYTFSMPNYHTLETNLYLTEEGIKEVKGIATNGKVLELTICNPSDNNFEDSIKLVVSAKGKTCEYIMPTSIYNGQRITYRFLVADKDIDTHGDYSVKAYFKEANSDEWIKLSDHPTGVQVPESMEFDGLEIYTIDGKRIKRIAAMDVDGSYSGILSSLPKGIYVIRDKNGTRKFVKQLP
jgi:hypothetical protein